MPLGLINQGNYDAGGTSSDYQGDTLFDALGRLKNDTSGVTAQNIFNSTEAAKARDFEAMEAEKARRHASDEATKAYERELYMSNTAYTRAAADMKAAGINPAMLSGLSSSGMRPASSGAPAANSSPSAGGAAAVARSAHAASSGILGGILRMAGTLIMLAGHPGVGAGVKAASNATTGKEVAKAMQEARLIETATKAKDEIRTFANLPYSVSKRFGHDINRWRKAGSPTN